MNFSGSCCCLKWARVMVRLLVLQYAYFIVLLDIRAMWMCVWVLLIASTEVSVTITHAASMHKHTLTLTHTLHIEFHVVP